MLNVNLISSVSRVGGNLEYGSSDARKLQAAGGRDPAKGVYPPEPLYLVGILLNN